ncbi:hypothetical protein NEMBOFW57_010660 [Staphylotrichum longicolle]|uniref:Uncharacterized protein n=1 Tax=Staphylotrichum longicolle TaxID=669026 RepID=A0AAD4EN67_9PEZI|nr:hypothetical protein NEMBOFW57_010660 [Staphylotrichum longicolle]
MQPSADAFAFSCNRVAAFDPWPEQISASDELSSINKILLPPGIHGFFLKEKAWTHLLLENIAPVNWDKKAFDRLVLPQPTKNLVKALVMRKRTQHTEPGTEVERKGKRYDLVTSKGGGLIMLLHGGSGTGKSLTAEFAEMPTYKVTRKDFGVESEFEKNLDSMFYLGQKWNCVLLQAVEYYDGTLILITRKGVQTLANWFGSKIQVALRYPALDLATRRRIWLSFLEVLRSDDERVDMDSIVAHIDDLTRHDLNGWHIRSAVTTARRLAASEKAAVAWSHLEQAIPLTQEMEKPVQEQYTTISDFDFSKPMPLVYLEDTSPS